MAILGNTTLTGCTSIPDFINTNTVILVHQTSAPSSWEKLTTHNNKALRVVSGNVTTGGTLGFTNVFTTVAISGSTGQIAGGGTVGGTTLGELQIPSHRHGQGSTQAAVRGIYNPVPSNGGAFFNVGNAQTGLTGGSQPHAHPFAGSQHNHPFTGNNLDFSVAYVDVILCRKI